ncbi:MAG: hypothetical protein WEE89_15990 [Gemmatimonadota bacterium]
MNNLDLQMGDFALFAVILLLMHAITLIEVGKGDSGSSQTIDLDRRSAATWSFVGVFLTLSVGTVADAFPSAAIDGTASTLPLFFMARWGFYHARISKLVDTNVIDGQLAEVYRTAVIRVFNDPNSNGLTRQDIAARALDHLDSARLLYQNTGVFRRYVPVSLGTILDRFLPNSKRLDDVLASLEREKIVKQDGERFYVQRAGTIR